MATQKIDFSKYPKGSLLHIDRIREIARLFPNDAVCSGCGHTYKGKRGLAAHASRPFTTMACKFGHNAIEDLPAEEDK
jgi:hypothetical protein